MKIQPYSSTAKVMKITNGIMIAASTAKVARREFCLNRRRFIVFLLLL